MRMQTIHGKQLEDAELLASVAKHPNHYFNKTLNEQEIICYSKKPEDRDTLFKLALPANMIAETIEWFHIVTGHPGKNKLRLMIGQRYYHPDLRRKIDNYHCTECQRHKQDGKGYGLLPEREPREQPFNEVTVDLIGPWKVQVRGRGYEFKALTSIDPVTNLVELTRIDNATSEDSLWGSRSEPHSEF